MNDFFPGAIGRKPPLCFPAANRAGSFLKMRTDFKYLLQSRGWHEISHALEARKHGLFTGLFLNPGHSVCLHRKTKDRHVAARIGIAGIMGEDFGGYRDPGRTSPQVELSFDTLHEYVQGIDYAELSDPDRRRIENYPGLVAAAIDVLKDLNDLKPVAERFVKFVTAHFRQSFYKAILKDDYEADKSECDAFGDTITGHIARAYCHFHQVDPCEMNIVEQRFPIHAKHHEWVKWGKDCRRFLSEALKEHKQERRVVVMSTDNTCEPNPCADMTEAEQRRIVIRALRPGYSMFRAKKEVLDIDTALKRAAMRTRAKVFKADKKLAECAERQSEKE